MSWTRRGVLAGFAALFAVSTVPVLEVLTEEVAGTGVGPALLPVELVRTGQRFATIEAAAPYTQMWDVLRVDAGTEIVTPLVPWQLASKVRLEAPGCDLRVPGGVFKFPSGGSVLRSVHLQGGTVHMGGAEITLLGDLKLTSGTLNVSTRSYSSWQHVRWRQGPSKSQASTSTFKPRRPAPLRPPVRRFQARTAGNPMRTQSHWQNNWSGVRTRRV